MPATPIHALTHRAYFAGRRALMADLPLPAPARSTPSSKAPQKSQRLVIYRAISGMRIGI
ncbi:MAG TPA: hypothetical protein VGD71_31215 [Kribbella sp.]|jgi:hypothetical protein